MKRYEIEYKEIGHLKTLAIEETRKCLLSTIKEMKRDKNIEILKVYRVNKTKLIYTPIKF